MHLSLNKILLGLLLGLLLLPLSQLQAKDQEPYVQDLKKNAQAIKELKKKQKKLQKQYSSEQQLLKRHDKELSQARQELQKLEQELNQTQEQLSDVQTQLKETNKQIQVERNALAHQIRIAYQQGKPHPLKVLLSEQQPGSWEQISVYHQAFMATRNERFVSLLSMQEEKTAQEATILALSETLQTQANETSSKEAKLLALKDEQKRIIKKLKRNQNQNTKLMGNLLDERKSLENLLSLWQSRQALSHPFSKQKGKLRWPVAGKVLSANKKLTQAHQKGVFFTAKTGTEIKAVHHGQVIFADWLRGFGMMCIIDHGDGFLTLYGHSEALTVKAGDHVQANQVIGFVGSSGGIDLTGVYFELRQDGKASNAKHWLAKK